MFEGLSFIGLLQKGGVTVMVLAVLSVVSLAIIIERAWVYRSFGTALRASFERLREAVSARGPGAGADLSRGEGSPLYNVFLAGYSRAGRSRHEISEVMELAGRAELARLERLLGVLGTIGSTAPFIGLFGTVLGIIRAFSDLAIATGATPAAVADGIAEALIATAAGLFVAVPAVMGYNYYVRTLSRHALALETMSTEFIDSLAGDGGGAEASKAAETRRPG